MASGSKATASPLTAWREARRLTQHALADALGYTQGLISKIEKGHCEPTKRFINLLHTTFPGADTVRAFPRRMR